MAVLIENSVTAYTAIIIIISSQNHRIKATSTPPHKRSGFSLLKMPMMSHKGKRKTGCDRKKNVRHAVITVNA